MTRSPISIIDVFFSAIISVIVIATEIRICTNGYAPPPTPPITRPNARPAAEPMMMLIIEIPMYFSTARSDHINDRQAELRKAMRVEKAAPRIP